MTPVNRPVSEDELHAYVDDRLPGGERARILRYLDENPATAARVTAWRRDRDALQQAFACKGAEPVPPTLDLRRLEAARRRQPSFRMVAAVAAALLIGVVAGWWGRGTDVPHGLDGLSAQAALSQRVFVAAADPVEFGPAAVPQPVGQGGPEAARAVSAPDLSAAGYVLLGGRLVATEQGTAVLFIYRGGGGERVGLFVRLMIGIDTNAPLRPLELGGISGFAWSHNGVGFGLVTDRPDTALRDLARMTQAATGAKI